MRKETRALLDALVHDGFFETWSYVVENPTHEELFDALVDDGHDVDLWADDPSMLRGYAEAVGFVVTRSYYRELLLHDKRSAADRWLDDMDVAAQLMNDMAWT
jgi:hypothetical protein